MDLQAATMAIVAKPAQTQMMRLPEPQRLLSLIALMRLLAEARGADVSSHGYEMYALAVAEFDDADVRAVVDKVARRRRGEGEKSCPELGELVEPLERMRDRRRQAKQQDEQKRTMIAEFWSLVPEWMEITGQSEAEILERWPSFKGTKPRL
jgi:hypothetical protein